MKLYILQLGDLYVSYDDLVKPYNESEQCGRKLDIPTWSLYLDHPDGKVLFDTGERYLSDKNVSDEELFHQLSLCGVSAEEIRYVVISHLHNDHAGKLDAFPNAEIVVQKKELEAAMKSNETTDPLRFYHPEELQGNIRWKVVEGFCELLEGIHLIPFPGHSDGLQGMMVSLKNTGKLLVTSDACYTSINYGPPIRLSSASVDDAESIESIRRIQKIAEENKANILFGHDSKQFASLKKAPEFYD